MCCKLKRTKELRRTGKDVFYHLSGVSHQHPFLPGAAAGSGGPCCASGLGCVALVVGCACRVDCLSV